MTKSERYTCAIVAVLECDMKTSVKAEVLETLMEQKKIHDLLDEEEKE